MITENCVSQISTHTTILYGQIPFLLHQFHRIYTLFCVTIRTVKVSTNTKRFHKVWQQKSCFLSSEYMKKEGRKKLVNHISLCSMAF